MDIKLYEQLNSTNIGFNELFLRSPSKHYKVYKIPKRTLGFRTIAQPTPAVKRIQKQIVSIISKNAKVHHCATAYVRGKGIKENANKHVCSEYILKVDLENFFNSVTPKMLFKALKKQKIVLSQIDEKVIEQFLFWNMSKKINGKLVLSVGAPSSPFISNLVMYSFDKKMEEYCSKESIVYTRYADDLTFSTKSKGILFTHLQFVRKMIAKEFSSKLMLNESKTVFSSKAHNRHVTGIVLTNNNKLSLGREKKRYISALIHKFKLGKLLIDDIYHLKGLLSHASHIERDFILKMSEKYGAEVVLEINKFSCGESNDG
ncbi:RNA-directed DNA polymerase [Shewanella sp. DNRA4]|uniref:retron St85 family RNA-directed DNA polymerase n=1 Tax=Shewanella sp. DNRA4 TaxID=2723055 RepID=UPI00146F5051|nr:retron St85 family RNA-directed DNA polymerase [Shewanella sp. DNRA4]NMD53206.1 RNA-directed DNA polymerase [Shewanella sp. DNRA4]